MMCSASSYEEDGGKTKKSSHRHKWLSSDVTLCELLADLDTGKLDNGTLHGWSVFALGLAFLSVCEVTWRLNSSYPGV